MLKSEHKSVDPPVLRVVDQKPAGNLVGLWGHTYNKDGEINWQFTIERELRFGRYILQLYSWWDGDATEAVVMSESKLLSKHCKLYLTREDWTRAADKHNEKRAAQRRAERAADGS